MISRDLSTHISNDIQAYPHIHISNYPNKIFKQDIHLGYVTDIWIYGIHMDISWISHGNLLGYPYEISSQDIHLWMCPDTWIYGDPHR
jgi:hypothetical protein